MHERSALALVLGLLWTATAAADIINVPADFATIQAAIVSSSNGDEIVVAPDTYFEHIDFLGKVITVRSTDPADPAIVNSTIINGTLDAVPVVRCVSGETKDSVLAGLTITGGTNVQGSGMRIVGSSPTVARCVFVENHAGGADGGGMFVDDPSDSVITNCLFLGNSGSFGGAFRGQGLVEKRDYLLVNCVFIANTATFGAATSTGSPLVNCTVFGNSASFDVGGLAAGDVTNCIVWGNSPSDNQLQANSVAYCCVEGGAGGIGNIDADPMFLDPDGLDNIPGTLDDDLRLMLGSPCADAGLDDFVPPDTADLDGDNDTNEPLPIDFAGLARFLDADGDFFATVDMGAYEFQPDCNGNRIPDDVDIMMGTSEDCDENGAPDECELDSNRDGVIDACDCNDNGEFDANDIATGTSQDFNQNGTPDECEGPFTVGEAHWVNPLGGSFGLYTNWFPETPWFVDPAVFDLDATYIVDFDRDFMNDRLTVSAGDITFSLAGNTYELTSTTTPSVVVGEAAPDDAALTITGGSVLAQAARIGSGAGATGAVTVSGPGAYWQVSDDLVIGDFGSGSLLIENGGFVVSRDAAVGEEPGSSGEVRVTGAGSTWIVPFFLEIDNGSVIITQGATCEVTFGSVFIFNNGLILGDGSFDAHIFNFGQVSPGEGPGVLAINDDYTQTGGIFGLGGGSGTLLMEIGGPTPGLEYDVLDVTGTATLGGGLFVELINGYEPDLAQEPFAVVSAPVIADTFDVSFFPGLPGGKFMRVLYGGASPAGAGEVTVVVDLLDELFGFGDPNSVGLDGAPTDVVLGDFDGDLDLDLAVTLPDTDPFTDGSVLILLNAGTDGGGLWQGFSGSIQVSVGLDPSSLTVGEFDGMPGLDIAVTNAGDDDVIVLFNDGAMTPSFTPSPSIPVGMMPSAIAAADFDRDGAPDLAVTNAADNTLQILANDGAGVFSASQTRMAGGLPAEIDPADVDNDKDTDAVVMNEAGDTVTVYRNLGGGVFDDGTEFPVGDGPSDLELEDLNGDGFVDAVTTNTLAGTVSVLLNTGTGDFLPSVDLPVGANPRSITVLDLEPDGDLDVALIADDVQSGLPMVQILRNDQVMAGDPLAFAEAESFDVGVDPVFVIAGDLDDDDVDDLITVNEGVGGGSPAGGGAMPSGPGTGSANVLLNAALATPPCPADIDGSGDVGFQDLLAVLAAWGPCKACPEDIDEDGAVAFNDLLLLLASWGGCP